MERPGSASPDEFAVPAAPDVGDLFDFATGGAPPAPPPAPRAAPLLPPPEWERTRPFLSGAFLLQARRPVLQQTPARNMKCLNSNAHAIFWVVAATQAAGAAAAGACAAAVQRPVPAAGAPAVLQVQVLWV